MTRTFVLTSWMCFFDGEGSTFVRRRDQYVVIGISQSDSVGLPAVLARFQRAVGGIGGFTGPIHVKTPAGGDAETKWIYSAFGHEMVQAVIAQIWPWLGSVKREQAGRALLAHRKCRTTKPRTPGTTFGRPFQETCKRGHDLRLAQVSPGRRDSANSASTSATSSVSTQLEPEALQLGAVHVQPEAGSRWHLYDAVHRLGQGFFEDLC